MHRRRSLGEVSVDRLRVGPGLRSPRWAGADTPVHIHRRTQARTRARSCIVHPCTDTFSRMHFVLRACARNRVRVCVCVWYARARACPCVSVRARATRSRFRSVFARRGASPSVAASRPAKILARSVCSLASFPLSPAAALFGALAPPPVRAPSPRLAFPFLRFSHSAERSPPSRLRTPFLPRAILHFDWHRRYREREDFDEERM